MNIYAAVYSVVILMNAVALYINLYLMCRGHYTWQTSLYHAAVEISAIVIASLLFLQERGWWLWPMNIRNRHSGLLVQNESRQRAVFLKSVAKTYSDRLGLPFDEWVAKVMDDAPVGGILPIKFLIETALDDIDREQRKSIAEANDRCGGCNCCGHHDECDDTRI